MFAIIDLTGKRFGRLVVLYREGSLGSQPKWFCKCDCGKGKHVLGVSLRHGRTKSCGCWRREAPAVFKTTHGMAAKNKRRSRIYTVWNGMIQRCHNPNQAHYSRYGGRGIIVCREWRDSFMAFYEHLGDAPKDGQRWTIDRIDNLKGYEPGNVRWATYKQQQENRRK